MDTVPRLFIESVCLRILDRRSVRNSTKIRSIWGKICTSTSKKIHSLSVLLDGEKKKIYAAAKPVLLEHDAVSLDSVDLKFITNFQIKSYGSFSTDDLPNYWKEITLDDLQKLVHFIRPVRNERHPLRNHYGSLNTIMLRRRSKWINGKLLSMRLPVDSVDLGIQEGSAVVDEYSKTADLCDEFFESAGPLYHIEYEGPVLKRSTVDSIIEKFVPIDYGRFIMYQRLSLAQIRRLIEKCVFYAKKVWLMVIPDFSTSTIKLTDLFDFDNYYSEKEVLREGMEERFGKGERGTQHAMYAVLRVHLNKESQQSLTDSKPAQSRGQSVLILATPTMDTVPRLFIESVCLCLLDRPSLLESTRIRSRWGKICTATSKKIHTLSVSLDGEEKKIYAAAKPAVLELDVSLDSVDLKFITNFRIETVTPNQVQVLSNSWKEITLDKLQKLVHFIRPVRNERHSLRYHFYSATTLTLRRGSKWINGKLLSMRLPVDSVDLQVSKEREEVDEFFEAADPLYYFRYEGPALKESTLDALIDKFVPIDDGRFVLYQSLSLAQIRRLVKECAPYEKKVWLMVIPDFSTSSIALTDLFDFDKYYSDKEVLREGMEVQCTNRGEARLKLQVRWLRAGWIEWLWDDANEPWH
uniref:F-box domain-containing protein n=1 Tax=Steinernema glaseri TaxID=37863 RepID=A0A1I7Z0F9_9BILA